MYVSTLMVLLCIKVPSGTLGSNMYCEVVFIEYLMIHVEFAPSGSLSGLFDIKVNV